MLGEYFSYSLSVTTHDNVQYTGGYSRTLCEFAKGKCGKRGASVGLDYNGAACGHSRRCLSSNHCVGKVPWSDATNNAYRLFVDQQPPIVRYGGDDVAHDALTFFGIELDKTSTILYFAYCLTKRFSLFGCHQCAEVIRVL